ncbi:hypothetical protein FJY93_02380 [Candidatus Kaiserbacteria bacterium]|nr:hypothetical protein [Candidatus Kaiserbacteria bacterium]
MGYRLSEVMIGAILGLGALVVYSLLSGLLDRALLETQPDDWFAQYVRSPDYYMDRAVYWLSWVLLAVLGLWFLSIASLSLQEPRTEANHNFFRNGLFAAAMILAVLGTITGYALIAWATPEVARWAVGAININVIILFTWCALFIIAGPVKESV